MILILYSFVFLFGLATGSFLNCVIYRLEASKSFLRGRSFCPKCNHLLSWQDLVPVFSFISLGGKCRYCKEPISWQYPLVEIATALLFLLIFNYQFPIYQPVGSLLVIPSELSNQFSINFQFLVNLCYLLIVSCFLIVIFVSDLRTYIIPDEIVYSAIVVSSIWYFVSSIFFQAYTKYYILNTIYSALAAASFFLAIVLISRGRWMGIGDIKLAFFMGLFLGWPNILVALFLAFFIGAIIGVGLILAGRKKIQSEVPFGPFLVIGTFIALFWGPQLVNWYLSIFHLTI